MYYAIQLCAAIDKAFFIVLPAFTLWKPCNKSPYIDNAPRERVLCPEACLGPLEISYRWVQNNKLPAAEFSDDPFVFVTAEYFMK
jgi:hypothetical protein